MSETNFDKLKKLETFAKAQGHNIGELAIAWILAKPWISSVIAGARKTQQVKDNVAASNWKLTPQEVTQIEVILEGESGPET